MKKIVTILGARPQFIKAAALSRHIAQENLIEEMIIHSGQHYDHNMSEVFFEQMEIPRPTCNLQVHQSGHGAMTGEMLMKVEEILNNVKPDAVLVYGDTNTTLAGALAAVKLHIPVVHVEAGLRSFNNQMPEEINRILTDRISTLLFCPTAGAVSNLIREGYEKLQDIRVINSGDIMLDVALHYRKQAGERSKALMDFGLEPNSFILSTFHRAENTDHPERLGNIVEALNHIHLTKATVIVPLHPRTREKIREQNLAAKFLMVDPVGYFDMIQLISNASLIITDSGGLQKEAFFFDKYCLTMRKETEWNELVQGGFNKIVNTNVDKIIHGVKGYYNKPMTEKPDYYGSGVTAKVIADTLLKEL